MDHRSLGPFQCSVLGLGTSMLASLSRGLTDRERSRVIDTAAENGINLIDTADSYAQGECERFLGRALHGRRERFVVCTKAGYAFATAGGLARLVRPIAKHAVSYLRAGRGLVSKARSVALQANVRSQDFSDLCACAEASLRRLRTDRLDVFLLHNPPVDVLRDPRTTAAAQRLIREGKVRLFGVSCDEPAAIDVAITLPEVSVIQTPMHPCLDATTRQVLSRCAQTGRALIANQTSLGGALLRPVTDAGDPYRDSRVLLQALAAKHGCSLHRLLLGYAAAQTGVACVLTGSTNPEHVRRNAADIRMPILMRDADTATIRAALAS